MLFLVTVGTSLFTNFLKANTDRNGYFDIKALDKVKCDITKLNNGEFKVNDEVDAIQLAQRLYESLMSKSVNGILLNAELAFTCFYEALGDGTNQLNGEIKSWLLQKNNSKAKSISAEVSTLFGVIEALGNSNNSKEIKVVLLPTQTYGGILAAKALSEFLPSLRINTTKINEVKTVFTEKLGSASDKEFGEGLKHFLGNVYRLSVTYKGDHAVHIIASGGYKSIIPYCTIAGILTDTPLHYAYEDDSAEVVHLPLLPIGIQKELFKPYAYTLRILENRRDKGEYESLPEKLKNLFVEENGSLKPSEFFNIAFGIYKNEFYKSPLQVESEGLSILKKLNERPDLLNYFKEITKISPYLWLGDKVPELVDHGLYHHDNLFAIADKVLSLIKRIKQDAFNALDVFLILATIFFHDWGHSVAHVDGLNRTLLPTEVRDFHHILSYKRIEEQKDYIFKRVFGIEGNGKQLSETILYPIALLCAYHRKVMPLVQGEAAREIPLLEENGKLVSFEPLVNKKCCFDSVQIQGEELIFLEALFRVIDSIDTQFVRIGSIDELIFKFRNFKMEITEEEKRLQNLKKLTANERIQCYDSVFEKLKGSYQARANAGQESQGSNDLKTLYKNLEEDHLMFLYVESRLRILMKDEQREHFLRHMFLDIPEITAESQNGSVKIKVKYSMATNFNENIKKLEEEFPDDKEWIEGKVKNLTLGQLVNGISSDYEKVKKILNNKGVSFDFIAKDQQN